jgi:uncharacterized membrane protein YfhO
MTDAYAEGWRIHALADDSQRSYSIHPADAMFRGIDLNAGRHHFIMEYRPIQIDIGRYLSQATLIAFLLALWLWSRRRRTSRHGESSAVKSGP